MKKLILASLALTCAASVFGQGAINWGNATGGRSPVYGPDPVTPSSSTSGQSSLGTPVGATAYTGPLLQGTGFTFALFGGPIGAGSNQLSLLATTVFRTATGNVLPAGLTQTGSATVPGATSGELAHYQIRVWNNQGGTLLDWASAQTAWLAGLTSAGVSPVLTSGPLGGSLTDGTPISSPNDVFTSFNIYSVPEPASFALAGLGAAAMLIFRRRK